MQVVASSDKEADEMLAELPVEHQLVIAYLYQESERRNEIPSDSVIAGALIFAERWRLANKMAIVMGLAPMTLDEALAVNDLKDASAMFTIARCH